MPRVNNIDTVIQGDYIRVRVGTEDPKFYATWLFHFRFYTVKFQKYQEHTKVSDNPELFGLTLEQDNPPDGKVPAWLKNHILKSIRSKVAFDEQA